ncbi:MAG: hypothetical protein JNK72_14935 [Myxococcales bacterium]|nr:hypothetical protein [Myxococcales bacterium]
MKHLRFAVFSAMLAACAAPQRPAAVRAEHARDWVPLRQGAAWSYDTQTGIGGDTVLATLVVVRVDGPRFLVRSSNSRTETWEYREGGVFREGQFILKDPVRVGTQWEGPTGGYEIRTVGEARTVGDQRFTNVVSVTHTARASGVTTTTYFAAGVGVIEIEASATSSRGTSVGIRSTLRGYTLNADGA